jgi:hypothetical protein
VATANATNTKLHPDFGHGTISAAGIPYDLVPGSQPKVPVNFYYDGDPGPYPIPANVDIEAASDHHAILIDKDNCVLYELFNLSYSSTGWQAGSGAIWSLNANNLRKDNDTSADAAGLPMLPGLIRYDEVNSGVINHALRFTIDHTRGAHIWPARHDASSLTGGQYPPMGQRFRLKAGYNISGFPQHVQVILQALKTYGMILADNGTSWHLSGVGDMRWDDNEMHQLTLVTGDNFEAVDESGLMVNNNSAQASTSTTPPSIPTGWVNLVSVNSAKCLDITGGETATGAGVPAQQWACWGGTNQDFKLTPVSGGYEITARHSGLQLEVRGGPGATGNGTLIEQGVYSGESSQIWTLTTASDGAYYVKPTNDGSCLDVRGISKANGAAVQQWACLGGVNQQWRLVSVP